MTANARPSDLKFSFADAALKNVSPIYPPQDLLPASFPPPKNEGEFFSITIPDDVYQSRIESLKDSFFGKFSYNPAIKQLVVGELRLKLEALWKIQGNWRLTPLGRGFYNVCFGSDEDRSRVSRRKHWAFQSGSIHLSNWCPNFNPYKLSSSKSQVWIRLYELPFEYGDSSILWALAISVGTPIRIDDNSLNGSYGHYATILVEIDFKNEVNDRIMVKRKGHSTFTYIWIENVPEFCSHCSVVGHHWGNCRRREQNLGTGAPIQHGFNKSWVTKSDNRPIGVGTETPVLFAEQVRKEGGTTQDHSRVVETSNIDVTPSVSVANSFGVLENRDPDMPELMELDEHGVAHVCKQDTNKQGSTNVVPKLKSILKRTGSSQPMASSSQGSMFGPIAFCARAEDSPNKRASKGFGGHSNVNVVSKDFSPASMAMNVAANKEYTRLDSMKPP